MMKFFGILFVIMVQTSLLGRSKKVIMKNFSLKLFVPLLAVFILFGAGVSVSEAQLKEPEVVESPEPATPLDQGYKHEIGFDVMLNNFGFGVGGHYNRMLGDFTEFTFKTGICSQQKP